MQAIQAQAAQWGLLARKLKRPGEPSDAEEKLAQDSAAGPVDGEALAAADPGTTDVQAGMEAIDSLTGAGESVQLASLSDGQMLAQAGATTSGSGSAAPSAAASSAAGNATAATASAPYLPLALVLGGVGLVAASGNSSAPTEALTIKGKLVDGYIAGATVFVDLNKNGQLDAGEASTVSDAQGNFTLPQGLNGPIVAMGGRDISTGLDFTGVLKAPAGSTTVTPLTTLVAELMAKDNLLTVSAAQDRVLDAVGLTALKGKVDLTKLDPVAGAAAGTAGALDLQKAGVMVATMVSSLTVKVQQTAGAGVDKHDEIASGIFAQVASTLTDASDRLSASKIATTASSVVNGLVTQANVGGVSFNGATMKAASVSALENLGALASKVASAATVDALAGNQKTALTQKTFTLQLLHFSDAEAGLLASTTAPKLAALIDKFEDTYAHSITLAGGDNFIPGPFLAAGTDSSIIAALNSTAGGTLAATATVPIAAIDIAIHNAMGVEASAIGNHEFDLGSRVLSDAIKGASGAKGAQFPHISANLDFSGDNDLKTIYVDTTATAGLEEAGSLKGKIVPSAILVEGGAKIGLVGATTQLLESISSPSGTKVKDNDSVRSDDMSLLAAQLQPVINDLIAQGVNKIILMAHLQLLPNERLLATKLQGVDIILAAGSNTRLGDANDTAVAFAGHDANFADTYPLVIKDKDGKNTLVVNTDNEFTYLGRLVVDFDENGHIVTDSLTANAAINGAYAATDANVATAWGTTTAQLPSTAYASGTRGAQVKALTEAVQSVITVKDGNVYGYADVYLEGERIAVRNQETNLGNITADANSYALEQALGSAAALTYIVSLKNGGGIRAQIGAISAPKSDGTVDKLAPEGGVSQLDVENSLRFNNQLMSFDTTPAGLKAILEHGVASLGSQGRFPQLSGVSFSYDPDLAAGSRISDIALVDDGYRINLYNDGALLAGAPAKITVVTLNFLANDGDSYPIKANGENFRYVVEQTDGGFALTAPVDEAKNFTETATITAAVGTSTLLGEQRAFEVYMKAFHATPQTAYKLAETAEAQDSRIQNLNVRAEDVLMTQLGMSPVGTFATNAFDAGGAEIVAFDAGTKRMFLVNAVAAEIQVVSLADPANPVLVGKLDLKGYATTTGSTPQVNSVASAGGVVAVALADADPTKAGKLVLFKADLAVSTTAAAPAGARALDAGVGPDMVTFTPDGKRLLVANEAESINERANTDAFYNAGAPFVANGGITLVTLGSEASSAIANATVQQLDFSAYNGKEGLLRERGVRIAAGNTAANDLEPEYIAVSTDGKQAMVTLQENNAVAVLDLSGAVASLVDIVALGYKNHARGDLVMTAYDTLSPTELGTIGTDAFGKAVPAGGFSGLHYTGLVNGKMRFLAVSDRGPNGEPVNVDADAALERPFVLHNYQARVSTLEFDPASKQLSIVSTTMLTRADGTPLTGLPNIPGTDEEPVQIVPTSDTTKTGTFTSGTTTLGYKTLAYDTLGADLEGIYQTASGSMWMVDEYRPAVYEFDAAGKMVARFVPTGTAALTADTTDNFGTETLPAHLIKRQANRGFEALAVDEAKGLLFAFVQSPLDSVAGSSADTAGPLVRIEVMAMRDLAAGTALPQGGTLAAAVSKGAVIAEYAYLLDRPSLRVSSQIDKIGDAAFNPATGTIFVFERDNEVVPEGKKMLFEIDLRGATNLLTATPTLPTGKTALEALTVDELLAAGINPVYKEILANLPTLGFLPNDKAEGLALLPNGGLAVINDNDFGVNGAGTETVGFGVLNFNGANRIDADNDTTGQPSGTIPGINIVKAGPLWRLHARRHCRFQHQGQNLLHHRQRGRLARCGRGQGLRPG
jgi:2',3'-cyclic-nucleotide 2'-phosphodiesterase (5'-nucleotidase family)